MQEIKAIRGKKGNHSIGQYNAHLLSGIVKCPQCGAPMYIGMTKWTNQDGTERRTESYVCSYATKHRGTSVCRRNGVVASQVEDEVMEYTRKIVRNPQFIKDLQEKVMTAVDMTEVENDISAYKKQLSALQRSRDSLERDIDRIAPDDKYAERRRADMTRRLNDLYDQIYKAEDLLQESTMKKATLESEQMSVQSMIGIQGLKTNMLNALIHKVPRLFLDLGRDSFTVQFQFHLAALPVSLQQKVCRLLLHLDRDGFRQSAAVDTAGHNARPPQLLRLCLPVPLFHFDDVHCDPPYESVLFLRRSVRQ